MKIQVKQFAKKELSSGEEGYAGVASGLCRLDVSAEASLCT